MRCLIKLHWCNRNGVGVNDRIERAMHETCTLNSNYTFLFLTLLSLTVFLRLVRLVQCFRAWWQLLGFEKTSFWSWCLMVLHFQHLNDRLTLTLPSNHLRHYIFDCFVNRSQCFSFTTTKIVTTEIPSSRLYHILIYGSFK